VSGRVDNTDGRYFPVSYLTNAAGDVLYEFHPGYLSGTEISDVVIEDINGDNLKDISITTLLTWGDTESYYAIKWDSYQMEDGRFYLDHSTEIVEDKN